MEQIKEKFDNFIQVTLSCFRFNSFHLHIIGDLTSFSLEKGVFRFKSKSHWFKRTSDQIQRMNTWASRIIHLNAFFFIWSQET